MNPKYSPMLTNIKVKLYPALFAWLLFMVVFLPNTHAQDFDPDSKIYSKVKKALRKWVSEDKSPFAQSVTYPEKWENESIIILYRRHFNDYRWRNQYGFTRLRLKLNDLRAVEKFSTIQFSPRDYLDIKIIKPDGKTQRINLKNAVKREIKLSKSYSNNFFSEQELYIALNGLNPGDILDVAILTRHQTFNSFLQTDFPTRFFKLDAAAHKAIQIIEQSLNGAPKMRVSKIKGGYYYELEDSLLEKSSEELKIIRTLAEPMVRFEAIHRTHLRPLGYKLKKNGVKNSLTEGEMARYLKSDFKHPYKGVPAYYYDFIKDYGYKLSDEEYFVRYYYYYRDRYFADNLAFGLPLDGDLDDHINTFIVHLRRAKIPYRFVLLPSKFMGGTKNMLFTSDLQYGLEVVLPDKSFVISSFGPYTHPDVFENRLEGQLLLSVSRKDAKRRRVSEKIEVPVSSASDNSVEISLTARAFSFPDSVRIQQTNIYSGHYAGAYHEFGDDYKNAIDFYSSFMRTPRYHKKKKPLYYFTDHTLYHKKTSLEYIWGEEERKTQEFIKTRSKARNQAWKEMLSAEYKVYSVDSFYPVSNGADIENKKVKFYSEFKIGEVFEHAGNIYFLNAGYLLGNLPEINQLKNRQNRKLPYFNSYDSEIKIRLEIEVPSSMRLTDVSSLNKSIETKAGSMNSIATLNGRFIAWDVVITQTGFQHPKEDWEEYLKLTDAIANLAKTQLVSE